MRCAGEDVDVLDGIIVAIVIVIMDADVASLLSSSCREDESCPPLCFARRIGRLHDKLDLSFDDRWIISR